MGEKAKKAVQKTSSVASAALPVSDAGRQRLQFYPTECALNRVAAGDRIQNIWKDGKGRRIVYAGPRPDRRRELAARDFDVVVLEKEACSGGQLNAANKPPHKEKMNWAIEDLTHRAEQAGAKILYNQTVTEQTLKDYAPYAIVVATGGKPGVPKSIPGADKATVMTGADAMMQELKLTGKDIVVVGTGLTGMETAEYFLDQDNRITMVEMQDKVGPGIYTLLYYDLYPKLADGGVLFMTSSKLTEVGDGDVTVETQYGAKVHPKADYVFFATGVRSQNERDVAKPSARTSMRSEMHKVGTILGHRSIPDCGGHPLSFEITI